MATIEIDGKTIEAENGKMIIEVADDNDIYIPRFCYHKKLSVAANCRMCLVQIENSRKTVPACATPVSQGMKVFTRSEEALHSQRTVMDFLLINHPLDCPICDQGGECELQDISMGFGHDSSAYAEQKRSVDDDNLGPLIATDMTRCIHCTRCVRFGEEIAGVRELGAVGRGEKVEISTYVQHSMVSEVSGNIIDLCPVGALTSKPYRFTARAWEMTQHQSIAPHDCIGSNIYMHTRRDRLMRVVPKENESINETWLSDRDRFSYAGLSHPARATQPKIKRDGRWETVDWQTALVAVRDGLLRLLEQHGPEQFAAFASPSSSVEELYLLQKLMRSLKVNNLDHRLQQSDFRDQATQPVMPTSTMTYASLDQKKNVLVIGSNVTNEVPLAGIRIRKAMSNGGQLHVINPMDYEFRCVVATKRIVSPQTMPEQLAKLIIALTDDPSTLPKALQSLLSGLDVDDETRCIASAMQEDDAAIVTGAILENHPDASLLRTLVSWIARLSGAKVLRLTTGANSAGACLSGMLPHRKTAGYSVETAGLDVGEALNSRLKGYFLMAAEPEFDFANPSRARQSMLAAEFVVALSSYHSEHLEEYADIILPIAPFTETSGTYINIDQTWQSAHGSVTPLGESRPAWKVLRVLGNLLELPDFDYASSAEVIDEVRALTRTVADEKQTPYYPDSVPTASTDLVRVGEWPLYRSDAVVRHSEPLQACASAEVPCVRVHPETAKKLNLNGMATISQSDIEITLPLAQDERLAKGVVWVSNGMSETIDLGGAFSTITISASE